MLLPFALTLAVSFQAQREGVDRYHASSDLQQIVTICKKDPSYLLPPGCTDPEQDIKKILHDPDYQTLVYRVDGSVVGFITFSKVERPLLGLLLFKNKGVVWLVGVDTEYQGRGYARELFEAAFEKCKSMGITHVDLYVLSTNTGACAAYDRLGFFNTSSCDNLHDPALLVYRKVL